MCFLVCLRLCVVIGSMPEFVCVHCVCVCVCVCVHRPPGVMCVYVFGGVGVFAALAVSELLFVSVCAPVCLGVCVCLFFWEFFFALSLCGDVCARSREQEYVAVCVCLCACVLCVYLCGRVCVCVCAVEVFDIVCFVWERVYLC